MQSPPLNGINVLDFSRVLAGPFCTKILAQLGARVIKVEIPGTGDDSRAFGPFAGGKSLYFSAINYDKQSIALNLKQAPDREIFEGLLGIADVLVENFRPGTMEKLGYGWETLHARYPKLIYGAASGFGDSGPYTKRAAYDMVVQGMGGIMSMTGQPNGPPTRVGVSICDLARACTSRSGWSRRFTSAARVAVRSRSMSPCWMPGRFADDCPGRLHPARRNRPARGFAPPRNRPFPGVHHGRRLSGHRRRQRPSVRDLWRGHGRPDLLDKSEF